jgi:hypothetical protein
VAASRVQEDELRRRLNDLEDRHEALAHAALVAVRVIRLKGHLLPNRLWSLPLQVRDTVALGVHGGPPMRWPQCRLSSVGTWASWSLGSLWRSAPRSRGSSSSVLSELLSGIDPLGIARKLPVRKKKSDSY